MTFLQWLDAQEEQHWQVILAWALHDAFPPVYESGCASHG